MHEIVVTHSIDAGHRVVGHLDSDGSPGKCSRLHGHTYGFTVALQGQQLNEIGFVVDFAAVKGVLDEWDHRLVLWNRDVYEVTDHGGVKVPDDECGIVRVPFNPTAENMAQHLAERFKALPDIERVQVEVRETAKTVARFSL